MLAEQIAIERIVGIGREGASTTVAAMGAVVRVASNDDTGETGPCLIVPMSANMSIKCTVTVIRNLSRNSVRNFRGTLAYGHSIQHVSGTDTKGQPVEFLARVTDGYRKVDGRGLIAHEHVSVPVDITTGQARHDVQTVARGLGTPSVDVVCRDLHPDAVADCDPDPVPRCE